jgi:hypothetical protein
MAVVDQMGRLETRLVSSMSLFNEAIRRGRVRALQCRYQRSAEQGAWYTQLWIVEPATPDHDLLSLQSEINVLCQRLAGRANAGVMSMKLTNGPWGPSLAIAKTSALAEAETAA